MKLWLPIFLAVGSSDPGVTINRLTPTIQATINMQSRRGQPVKFILAYTTNTPPIISLGLADHTVVTNGQLRIAVEASDPDAWGAVSRVQFFAGNTQIGETTNAAMRYYRLQSQ